MFVAEPVVVRCSLGPAIPAVLVWLPTVQVYLDVETGQVIPDAIIIGWSR